VTNDTIRHSVGKTDAKEHHQKTTTDSWKVMTNESISIFYFFMMNFVLFGILFYCIFDVIVVVVGLVGISIS
jgi:hypothetical protein